jgi:serine/threonine-protein kinase ULK/ATG1
MTSYNTATLFLKHKEKQEQELHPTTILGNYEIVRKSIGRGSFSKIYRGRYLKTNKQIAIKIIKKRNIKNENNILREIQVMKMMNHINVIQLIDVLASDNKYYLILEYCPKGDLKKYTQNQDISEHTLHKYMTQIRDGLYELYTKNIIHRDLKPHNILVANDGTLKISDFGFAKSYNPDENLKQTMCGSPIYMAPEILQGHTYNITADLWSFGVIMYELFYNKVPISGHDIGDLITNVRKFEYTSGNKEISPEGDDLLRRLLKKDPNVRISWSDFVEHPWFTNIPTTIDLIDSIDIEHDTTNIHDNSSNSLIFSMDDIHEKHTYKHNKNNKNDKKPIDILNSNSNSKSKSLVKITDSQPDIDLDETVLFRSDVNINNSYRCSLQTDSKYIESEFYDDNYVIITSPSEMDIYSRPHLKSYDPSEARENENEYKSRRIAKYVQLKRIFNSLRDSISYIFRPKSV